MEDLFKKGNASFNVMHIFLCKSECHNTRLKKKNCATTFVYLEKKSMLKVIFGALGILDQANKTCQIPVTFIEYIAGVL